MSLGRGLGALLPPTPTAKPAPVHRVDAPVWEAPLASLKPDPNQPRKTFRPEDLQELSDSIKMHGVLEPLLVSELDNGSYQIIAGERRYRAAKIAGLTTVPIIVKKIAAEERLEVALIENIQRADLNPLEEAFAYKRLIEEFGLTQQQVATKVGKSRPVIANMVRLLDLPSQVHAALNEGRINMSQARTLLALENDADRLSMLSSMLGEKISVRELEQKVALRKPIVVPSKPHDPNRAFLENELRSFLGAQVAISARGEKGSITISYHSSQELRDLIERITKKT